MATATTPRLSAAQARRLHDAEVEATRAKRALEAAEAARDELRAKLAPKVPLSADPEERAKGVRVDVVGGVKIRITPCVSAEYFHLSGYRKAGHPVTPEMAEHVREGRPYDRWTVTAAAGPKKIGAVEPS